MYKKLVVAGVGLIGGSFALAMKRAGLAASVAGLGRSRENLDVAARLGIIDEAHTDAAAAAHGADLVLLATPVGQMAGVMDALAPHLGGDTLIMDAGSTKANVVAMARARLAAHVDRFVPAHPIAGAELSGAPAARADLFDGRQLILTPWLDAQAPAAARAADLWARCGAVVSALDAATHDAVFAAVSHLPHLLAFALVDEFAGRDNAVQLFAHAGGGFRDFTRIAASHPEMWRDICLANRDALLRELDAYRARLDEYRGLVAAGDGDVLGDRFTLSRRARQNWKLKPAGEA